MTHKSLTARCAGGTDNKAKSDLLRQQVLTEDYPSYQEQENWKTRYRDVLLEWEAERPRQSKCWKLPNAG